MTWKERARQARTIALLELRRVFFSKRSFWVYLLALFPTVIFFGHGLEVKLNERRWSASGITPAAVLDSIPIGSMEQEVIERAGRPAVDRSHVNRRRDEPQRRERYLMYFDGKRRVDFWFEDGALARKNEHQHVNFEEDRQVYAAVFQYFYLRLAIFFGCLGIFMNLFRGEMLDKTLHFWFLAPARRDVLLVGKYLAGLGAAVVIFTAGAILCFAAMLWPQDPSQVQAYWRELGAYHLSWYAVAAAAGCVGYGSVFLAAGLLLRNPIIPAVVLLIWESINGFLPAVLQKLSVLYYIQSIAPVPAPTPSDMPPLARLFLSPAEPPSTAAAIVGLLAVTALVLWSAAHAVRRLEINYGTD